MKTRKQMKQAAKGLVKKHYLMFLMVCLIAAVIGSECTSNLTFINTETESAEEEDEENVADTAYSIVGNKKMSALQIARRYLGKDEDEQEKLKTQIEEQLEKDKNSGSGTFARSRGVFSKVLNGITSGSIYMTILNAAISIVGSKSVAVIILICFSVLFVFLLWFYLVNTYKAVSRRMFLEGRCYEQIPVQRFLYFLRVKKLTKAAWTMFVTYVFLCLWTLTVVGGIIKHYSYFLVPYIVAENPDMKAKEAIALSRKMMNGHKFECFVLEISFLLWDLFASVTAGLAGLFFVSQYKIATYTEYYSEVRRISKEKDVPGAHMLNDDYLFEKADEETLSNAYGDVASYLSQIRTPREARGGVLGFISNVFGIVIHKTEKEFEYEKEQAEKNRMRNLIFALKGEAYPCRLSAISEKIKRETFENLGYQRHYSIWSMILIFFTLTIFGWVWEVMLTMITEGVFVNRGVLHGPWLPIYGMGGVLILVLLNKLRTRPILEFFATIVVCGILEYFMAYYLEITHGGTKWWDYSGYFLNINGRICAEGLLVFGIGGAFIVYVAAPLLDNIFRKLSHRTVVPICLILLSLYIIDQGYSAKHPNVGRGVTDYTAQTEWVNGKIQDSESNMTNYTAQTAWKTVRKYLES